MIAQDHVVDIGPVYSVHACRPYRSGAAACPKPSLPTVLGLQRTARCSRIPCRERAARSDFKRRSKTNGRNFMADRFAIVIVSLKIDLESSPSLLRNQSDCCGDSSC